MRFLALILLTGFFCSCGTPPVQEAIVGRWIYDHVDFKATANNPDINDYERENIAEAAVKIQQMYIEFYNDKTYDTYMKMEDYDVSKHGTYAIEGDGKYVATTRKDEDGSTENERLEIVRLTDDSLTLVSAKGAYVVYARAK